MVYSIVIGHLYNLCNYLPNKSIIHLMTAMEEISKIKVNSFHNL